MNILALDSATPSSAVALARADGWLREARDDVAAGARPRHAQRVLELAAALLAAAELPAPRMIVSLTHLGGDRRRIEVSG